MMPLSEQQSPDGGSPRGGTRLARDVVQPEMTPARSPCNRRALARIKPSGVGRRAAGPTSVRTTAIRISRHCRVVIGTAITIGAGCGATGADGDRDQLPVAYLEDPASLT